MNDINLGGDAKLLLRYGNRHGLVTGATGTGKTVTLQRLAEGFSAAGVPVFAADIKGDLSGVGTAFPVRLWDLFDEHGLPIKTSVDEMGPMMLSRLFGLNATQEGILNIGFKWLDDPEYHGPNGCGLMDLEALQVNIADLLDHREDLRTTHGNVTAASVGAIQRAITILEGQGGGNLFGEPSLDIMDFLKVGENGRGVINLLCADRLVESPKLYGAFLLWLLMKLFDVLPEAGDLDKPKLVFFFDEAHMLFSEASPALLETIERVVRLIRSKGVGVYFVTQHPRDVPVTIQAQLGNRIQHALRAFTPIEQRSVKSAADTFRQNPALDIRKAIMEMPTGEAVVSFFGEGGKPEMAQRVKVGRPIGRIGPLDDDERYAIMVNDPLAPKYGVLPASREEAFEIFWNRYGAAKAAARNKRKGNRAWRAALGITASTGECCRFDER